MGVFQIGQDQADRRPAAVEILVGRVGEDAVVGAVGGPFDEQAARGFLVAGVGEEQTATLVRVVGAEGVHLQDDVHAGGERAGAAPPEKQKPVERLVDRILAAKQRDAEADVSALEREIDELVYALYGLAPEEIKIVEGASK